MEHRNSLVRTRSLRRRFWAMAASAVAATALALSGCAGPASDGPVTLEYWTWTPNMQGVIDVWNKQNPDIHVNLTEIVGEEATPKFLASIQAGSGAPDIMHVEYQQIPTYVAKNAIVDIAPHIAEGVRQQFPDALWNSVSLGTDAVYGVPGDFGPMSLYYRTDVFGRFGLAVPTTWDEFAAAARKLHAADPKYYLTNFDPRAESWMVGYAQQAGASWWKVADGNWSVDINNSVTQKVMNYWGGLVEEGVISTIPSGTPQGNAALADGTQAVWISGAWGAAVLPGTAPDAAGKWAVAPIPQWDPAKPMNGTIGGSAEAVSAQSTHPEQAAQFAQWLNASKEGVAALVGVAQTFPASREHGKAVLTTSPAYFSNQANFWDVVGSGADHVAPFTYGPNFSFVTTEISDKLTPPVEARSRAGLLAAVADVQQRAQADLVTQGFAK